MYLLIILCFRAGGDVYCGLDQNIDNPVNKYVLVVRKKIVVNLQIHLNSRPLRSFQKPREKQ